MEKEKIIKETREEEKIIPKTPKVIKQSKPEPCKTQKFIKVKCHKCGKEQIIFGRASTKVVCLQPNCDEVLATPRGGKASINAEIIELV